MISFTSALALRIALLLAGVALLRMILRRASASEVHWLWMLGLVGAATIPAVQASVPAVRIVPVSAAVSRLLTGAAPRAVTPESRVEALVPPVSDAENGNAVGSKSPLNIETVLILLWASGTIVMLGQLVRAHRAARRIVAGASAEANPSASTETLRSSEIDAPFTYGLIKSVVVLPFESSTWSPEYLEATLLHERAHAVRRDGIALLVSQAIVAFYWWHPMVWFASRAAAEARERACDDVVITSGMRPSEYGKVLLSHAAKADAWRAASMATVMFAHFTGLGSRIAALVDPRIDRRSASSPRPAIVLVLVGSVIGVSAGAARAPENGAGLAGSGESAACVQADPSIALKFVDGPISISGSGSTNERGVTRIIWTGTDCIAWQRFTGPVEISRDERTVLPGDAATFLAHDQHGSTEREYAATSSSSSFKLNGKPATMSAADSTWLAAMAREHLRRTGKRALERARNALRSGSLDGLIAEVSMIPRSDIREQYLSEGYAGARNGTDVVRLIRAGSGLLDRGAPRARFLLATPARYRTEIAVLNAIYDEAALIETDRGLEAVLGQMIIPRNAPPDLRRRVAKVISAVSTDDARSVLRDRYLSAKP